MLEPIEQSSAWNQVVTRVERAIRLGTLVPGDKLPAERVLAADLGVSRMTIREAIRVLEARGYVETRRGAHGGTMVRLNLVSKEKVREQLLDRVDHLRSIFEFRQAVECAAARLAASRRQPEHLDLISESIDEMEASTDLHEFRRADSTFHLRVADAACNPLIAESVEDARVAMFLPVDALEFEVALMRSLQDHRRVFSAISRSNEGLADKAMAKHIERTRYEIFEILGIDDLGEQASN